MVHFRHFCSIQVLLFVLCSQLSFVSLLLNSIINIQTIYFIEFAMQEKELLRLNDQKVFNMLKLEELFHNHYLSAELLHQLISLYTVAIEHSDEDTSPLKLYFLEKIQFVLSRPEILKMLENVSKKSDEKIIENLRETIRLTGRQNTNAIIQCDSPKKPEIISVKHLYNYDGENQTEKKKKIAMQFKLMEEIEEGMQSLKQNYDSIDLMKSKQNKRIEGAAKEQDEKLKQRLAIRKKRKRKTSFDEKQLQSEIGPVKKQELIEAQKQVMEAVVRITNRMTLLKELEQQSSRKTVQGRVKKTKNSDDYD